MNKSIRLNKKLNELLNEAVLKTGKARSEIIHEAIKSYCLSISRTEGSLYDKLMAGNWKPVRTGMKSLSTDKELLRQRVRARAERDQN